MNVCYLFFLEGKEEEEGEKREKEKGEGVTERENACTVVVVVVVGTYVLYCTYMFGKGECTNEWTTTRMLHREWAR